MTHQFDQMRAEDSLAHQTIAVRDINKKMTSESGGAAKLSQAIEMSEQTTLVFSRYLGHKLVIPNSGRWMVHTKPKHECWICEKYTMSYFFWSPK